MDVSFWSFPWFTPHSEIIKLISCKGLIEYYLGDYIKERKLNLDQISVNVYKGTGTVSNIHLDCEALSRLGKKQNWPVKIVEGHMEDVTVRIPWTNLFSNGTVFKISGLSLTLHPTVRTAPASSILKWVFSNWAETKRIVIDNKHDENKQKDDEINCNCTQPTEFFMESINSLMKRFKVKLENTRIRIEHMPKDRTRGIALNIVVKNIYYYDDTTSDPVIIETDPTKTYIIYTYPRKKVRFEGVTLFTDEYPKRDNENNKYSIEPRTTIHRILIENTTDNMYDESNIYNSEDSIAKNTSLEKPCSCDKLTVEDTGNNPVLFAKINGSQGLSLSYECADDLAGPKFEAEIVGPFIIMLSPKQLDSIIEIIESLNI